MQNHIELLQGYYNFLSLGKFFEFESKMHLLEVPSSIRITTGDRSTFSVNTHLVSSLLTQIYSHPEQKNVFGYLLEISAFRGIFSIMREMIEDSQHFRKLLQSIFQDQYLAFEQTIRFLRNVLSHTTTTSIFVQPEDYQKQQEFLASHHLKKIRLNFVYSNYLLEREGSPDYACMIEIDFSTLQSNRSLRKIVSLHQMYLLAELCYNISKVIAQRTHRLTSKTVAKSSPQSSPKSPKKTSSSRSKKKVVTPTPKQGNTISSRYSSNLSSKTPQKSASKRPSKHSQTSSTKPPLSKITQ